MATNTERIQFMIDDADERRRLEDLPWLTPLEEWEASGVPLLVVRKGDSRHPVVFVEQQGARYAIKETTPRMAQREIRNLAVIEHRGIPALSPIGTVQVKVPPIALDIPKLGGIHQYISGDRGYTVTRLAPRVVPHVLLYRLPLTRRTKQRLLSAVAVLMIELHEHGVYWGDPSLANALIRIDGKRILGIMADAETAELFPGPISDGLREQDLAQFGESLAWQAEDLRQARGLPEDVQVLDDNDFEYFMRRYRILRREHARLASSSGAHTLYQFEQFLQRINRWGFAMLDSAAHTVQKFTTVLPGWYQKRVYQLLHVTIPRPYAHRFYNLILGHQAIMSQQEERDVDLEEAAQHWYERYHLPTILMLRQRLSSSQDPMLAYFAIMEHKWNLSVEARREIPLEEAILDYFMHRADTGDLGPVDPAHIATWWRDHTPVASALELPMIESEELDPLLATAERPLVHLPLSELEHKLPEILEREEPDIEDTDTKQEQ